MGPGVPGAERGERGIGHGATARVVGQKFGSEFARLARRIENADFGTWRKQPFQPRAVAVQHGDAAGRDVKRLVSNTLFVPGLRVVEGDSSEGVNPRLVLVVDPSAGADSHRRPVRTEDTNAKAPSKVANMEGSLPAGEFPKGFDRREVALVVFSQPLRRNREIQFDLSKQPMGGHKGLMLAGRRPLATQFFKFNARRVSRLTPPQHGKSFPNLRGKDAADFRNIWIVLDEKALKPGHGHRRRAGNRHDIELRNDTFDRAKPIGIFGNGETMTIRPTENVGDFPRGGVAFQEVMAVGRGEERLDIRVQRRFFVGPLRMIVPPQELSNTQPFKKRTRLSIGIDVARPFAQPIGCVAEHGADVFFLQVSCETGDVQGATRPKR